MQMSIVQQLLILGSRVFRGHSASVSGVSFFPDPNFFISSSEDKSLRLWNVNQASDVAVYKGHNYQVQVGVIFAEWRCVTIDTCRLSML